MRPFPQQEVEDAHGQVEDVSALLLQCDQSLKKISKGGRDDNQDKKDPKEVRWERTPDNLALLLPKNLWLVGLLFQV